jgi:Flp pilus assembly protein TadD
MATLSAGIAAARRLEEAGRIAEAEAAYLAILKDEPREVSALNLLGLLCHRQGRHREAADLIGRALTLQPNDVQALANLGAVQMSLADGVAAIASFRRAAELAPDHAPAWRNLGLALLENREPAAAAEVFAGIARAHPGRAQGWNDLGAARHRAGDADGAAAALREALRLDARLAGAWCNLGAVQNDQGLDHAAIASFSQAIAIEPSHIDAHVFRGACLLRQGQFAEGWQDYDWRLKQRRGPRVDRGFHQPRWQGEDFTGRRLLIHAEQGLGDTIQFMRYLPLVKARGGAVIFEVQAPLRRLIVQSPAMDGIELVAEGKALPQFDLYCPLLSLPRIFATELSTIPTCLPYLAGDPVLHPPLPARSKHRRWAIAWAGNPRHPADRLRSLPGSALDRLAELHNVEFVSLQMGSAARPEILPLIDAAPYLADFAVTAAVLAGADLVIAVDTALAHLAGAMGKPTWLLLPHVADWRWLTARSDSPWYPNLRLYRQPQPGDWTSVIEQIAGEAGQGA